MRAEDGADHPDLRTANHPDPRDTDRPAPSTAKPPDPKEVDVVVVGAGPAGVPAALAAAEAGARVVLVDANPRPGGQFHRQLPTAFDVRAPGALHHGWSAAARAFAALDEHPRIEHLGDTRAWHVERVDTGVRIDTAGAHRRTVTARTVILATGATERVLPFPGWDLPGVLTVGAAQALVKGQGVRPGRRVLVAGTGPLLLASAGTLLAAGTDVAAVLDANGPTTWASAAGAGIRTPARTAEAARYLGVLIHTRTPYRPRRAVVRAEGDGHVQHAVVAEVERDWRIVPGSEEFYDVDAICVSFGFTPNAGIAAALGCSLREDLAVDVDVGQRTNIDGILAAGEVTGVAGASVAALEGAIAGAVAAERSGFCVDRAQVRRTVRRRDRERRAVDALLGGAPIRDGWTTWLEDETIVCRCEDVPYGQVHAAIGERGAHDMRSVKMTTRCGMGRCQAAMCGPNVADLVRAQTGIRPADADGLVHRSVAEPVPLGEL